MVAVTHALVRHSGPELTVAQVKSFFLDNVSRVKQRVFSVIDLELHWETGKSLRRCTLYFISIMVSMYMR